MGHGVTERMKKVWWSRFFVVYLQHQNWSARKPLKVYQKK
jgi:hypothetical protein